MNREVLAGPVRHSYWWATSRARARPTFLVIGAQRCGTTSLRRYLRDHPAVLCAEPKEVHYFDKAFRHGTTWYLGHFPWKTEARAVHRRVGVGPAVGEATPEYLFYPWVPERVAAFRRDLRFVVVLRNPVDRAYSQYQMHVRVRGDTRTFEEALALEEAEWPAQLERRREDPESSWQGGVGRSYVARGMYAEQLERWFAFFNRSQFLVLTTTELFVDTSEALARVTAFLGVFAWDTDSYPRLSAGNYEPMASPTRQRLAQLFKPHNRRLERLLGRKLDWDREASDPAQT